MRSTTLFFNKALHRSDWRRFWPLLFLYAGGWTVALPLALWSGASRVEELPDRIDRMQMHLYGCTQASSVVAIFFGLLLAMALFSYLMRPNSVGLMHALPMTRTAQFCNHFLVGVEMFTAGNIFVTLLALLVQAARAGVSLTATMNWLLVSELTCLFFFALATVCAMLTGWVLAVPVIYAGVNFVFLGVSAVLQTMGEAFYYGYEGLSIPAFVVWLTPTVKLVSAVGSSTEYSADGETVRALLPEAVPTLIVYSVAALALIALACLLYRRRRSETAADAIVFEWLKPVVKYVISIAGGLGLGLILCSIMYWNGLGTLLLCQFLMGGICYLAVEMLLRKTFKIFKAKMWLGLAALLAALTALTLCVRFDIGGYQTRVPAEAQVESVEFGLSGMTSYWQNAANAETAAKVIAVHQAIVDAYEDGALTTDDDSSNNVSFDLDYTLKDGGTFRRSYYFAVEKGSALHQALNELMNLPAVRSQNVIQGYDPALRDSIRGGYATNWHSYNGEAQIQLTRQQAQAIYDAFGRYITSSTAPIDVLDDVNTEISNVRVEFDSESSSDLVADQFPAKCTEVLDLLVEYGLADSPRELVYRDEPINEIYYD